MIAHANGVGNLSTGQGVVNRVHQLANREAELSVTYSVLIDPACLATVLKIVRPEDFADADIAHLLATMRRRHQLGEPVDDVVMLKADLKSSTRVADPDAFLADVLASQSTSVHAEHYAKIVRDLSRRRGAVLTAEELASRAVNLDAPIDTVLVDAHAELDDALRVHSDAVPAFARFTCRDLMAGDFSTRFLIDGTLVAGQPLILAGPQKVLKTSFIVDAAISMATATPMLGRLDVSEASRVGVMTGESGMATLKETAQRVAISKRLHLDEITGLVWSPDVPRFGDPASADAVRRFIEADELDVLFVDPAYLCIPGADAGNLMIQGKYLRSMAKLCGDLGTTLVLAHHTNKAALNRQGGPLQLEDIAWAGFKEFARQWWLLSRRETYVEGSGEHKLWLSVGGSAGHSYLWGVDVVEGVYEPGQIRRWEVSVSHGRDVWAQDAARREDDKERAKADSEKQKLQRDREKVVQEMTRLGRPESLTQIAGKAGLNNGSARTALESLIDSEDVRQTTYATKTNKHQDG